MKEQEDDLIRSVDDLNANLSQIWWWIRAGVLTGWLMVTVGFVAFFFIMAFANGI